MRWYEDSKPLKTCDLLQRSDEVLVFTDKGRYLVCFVLFDDEFGDQWVYGRDMYTLPDEEVSCWAYLPSHPLLWEI